MLFRPEEVDPASSVIPVPGPLSQRDTHITLYLRSALTFNGSIPYHDAQWLTTMQTRSIHLNRFTRKDPAHCQGFKTSLRKPFLLSVNSDAIWRGQVVKGRK